MAQQAQVRIAVLGLGLIGGSLGKAIRRGVPQAEVVGYDSAWGVGGKAERAGAIDRTARNPEAAVRDAALVLVATPILATGEVFQAMAPALAPGAVVMDTASTKTQVMAWAREFLPPEVDFVGGHPMAGKETSGIEAADADLFRDKPFVLIPSVDASERGVRLAIGLVEAIGAKPVFMDAEEHDSYVAAVSHVPLVASAALFLTAFESQAWPELASLASSGFRDTTRLASGSPEMSGDIARTNRANVVHWLNRYLDELRRFRDLIESASDEDLFKRFGRAALERDNFITSGAPSREPPVKIETVSLSDMLIGQWATRAMKRSQEMLDAMERGDRGRRKEG